MRLLIKDFGWVGKTIDLMGSNLRIYEQEIMKNDNNNKKKVVKKNKIICKISSIRSAIF